MGMTLDNREGRDMERILSVKINEELCTGCGRCVRDCVSKNLKLWEEKAVLRSPICLECGHCFAICPAGAVDMPGFDTSDCGRPGSMTEFDPDRLLLAMKSRRSIRQFKPQKVEREKLMKILEAGRYAPTAKNEQPNSFIVLDERINEMENLARSTFERFQRKAGALSENLAKMKLTEDFFFKGGPQAVVIVSENETDAGIAASYMELMAESMGLGTLYSGFFVAAARLGKDLRAELGLEAADKVAVCLVVGYPDVSYERTVPRQSLRAVWK